MEFIRSKTQIEGISIVPENENLFQEANEPCNTLNTFNNANITKNSIVR